ncbi:hypothetical protein R1flu_028655 [Riccia fluitans]|uniref:Myb-like domain-containing protein n=1 Tax=Riccia fluitans TaxID=41844 RepID=A0ABD1XMB5_9MARC
MQTSGPYGVPQEFVVRPPPPHMFSLSPHDMTLSPSTGHGHPHHLQQHPQHHQQHHHQQHQQHHHPQQHPQHPQHSQHAQQHPQHPQQHPQHPHHAQLQQQQQQQQMVQQQLGLGPDSPEAPSPVASRPSPTSYKQRESLGDDDGGEEEGRGAGGNRWPRQETLALIKIRSEMDANFRDSGLKGPLWEDVSRKLAELGYNRSAKKCKEKFENVHKYYKKTKDGRAGRQDGKSYRFFSQLEALYGGGGGGGGGNHHHHNQQQAEGGGMMLTGGSGGGAIGGGAEGNLSSQRPAENSSGVQLSSDSEDDYDDPGDNDLEQQQQHQQEDNNSKKRKRKEGKVGSSKMQYFEGLVKKLIEKQEAMQRKFLDALERREQERQAREEAWKRQEMARVSREHELRAQEHALAATRDAALVAFLQKVTGQTLQLPQITPPAPPPPVQAPPPTLSVVIPEPHHSGVGVGSGGGSGGDEQGHEKESFDPNSKRWPKPEVQALIRLRSQMEPRFQEAGPKGPLWEEISTGMACLGYNRNAKRCKEKWENINKYFRKTKETNKKRPDNAKTCPYFHQLDMLYRKGVLGNPSSKLTKMDDNSEDLIDHQNQRGGGEEDSGGGGQGGGGGNEAAEILAIMPAAGGEGAGASTSNGGATHFFSSPDNGSSGDRGSMKKVKKLEQNMSTSASNGSHSSSLALKFDGLRGDGETFSGTDKSVRLEGLVRSLLEQQQQQQQRFEEDFERREQERELRENERRHEEDYRFAQERARTSSRDVALMALVHKLAGGDSAEFAGISAPSSSE